MNAQGKMADDGDYDTVKTNHCPMFDGMHVSFQKWWIRFEIYAITNGLDDAISKDGSVVDLPTSSGEFALSLNEKKMKAENCGSGIVE